MSDWNDEDCENDDFEFGSFVPDDCWDNCGGECEQPITFSVVVAAVLDGFATTSSNLAHSVAGHARWKAKRKAFRASVTNDLRSL